MMSFFAPKKYHVFNYIYSKTVDLNCMFSSNLINSIELMTILGPTPMNKYSHTRKNKIFFKQA
jgi:hypothetical protein